MKMKKVWALLLALAMVFSLVACGGGNNKGGNNKGGDDKQNTPQTDNDGNTPDDSTGGADLSSLNVGVFYYNFSDVYISTVRAEMDAQLDALGIKYADYDGNTTQSTQMDQVNTAITNGANLLIVNIVENSSPDAAQNVVNAAKEKDIPVIFFNRDFDASVINSYEKCAFVGTDPAEAGHMQGKMIADYLLANYDATDLNGDGAISYVMFKGQEGNVEAEYRTQYSVEDANAQLTGAGKAELTYYGGDSAASKYLVDPNGAWSSAAATNYMDTILAEYSETNNNMIELVICNNDDMAMGAISSLQTAGYNNGSGKTIPVFGVDAVQNAKDAIAAGSMTGTVAQDAVGMATSIITLLKNFANDGDLMSNTGDMIIDPDSAKIRVPYAAYLG